MNVNFQIPSEDELAILLSEDVLRNKKTHSQVTQSSDEEFCSTILKRCALSRFDPRIAESCVERLLLFYDKLDLKIIINHLTSCPWPSTLSTLLSFALRLAQNKDPLSKQSLYLKAFYDAFKSKTQHHNQENFQSYYIALYTHGSSRILNEIQSCHKEWSLHGYWALSAPYSKELLTLYSNKNKPLKKTTAANLKNTLKNIGLAHLKKYLNINQIIELSGIDISKRQILRHIKQIPQFKKIGLGKATRYRYLV